MKRTLLPLALALASLAVHAASPPPLPPAAPHLPPPPPPVVALWWTMPAGSLTTNMQFVVHKSPTLVADRTLWPVYATLPVAEADLARTDWAVTLPAVADGNYYVVETVNTSPTRPSSTFSTGAVPRDEPAPVSVVPMGIKLL